MSKTDQNRRQHRRVPAKLVPSLSARLSGGAAVTLLDVSRRGVRLETALHMRPGQTVAIRVVAADATITLSAAVVRATVARVDADGIRYETALSLAGDLVLCEQLHEAAMLESETAAAAGAPPTRPGLEPVVDYTVIVRGVSDAPVTAQRPSGQQLVTSHARTARRSVGVRSRLAARRPRGCAGHVLGRPVPHDRGRGDLAREPPVRPGRDRRPRRGRRRSRGPRAPGEHEHSRALRRHGHRSPATLCELAARFGGGFELSRPDTLTQRLVVRVPRAFVISHAA